MLNLLKMGAEKMQTFSLDWMQEAEKLLQQLPGIFAVRFLAGNDHSTLEAIHILADTARNAKQVVRDVQAALSAAYALDIDHRIVSVAQLPVNPVKKEGLSESVPFAESRVKFNGLAYQDMPNRCSVQVTLQYQQTDYQGCAEGKPGRKWQDLLAAQATLNAVGKLLGETDVYTLLHVQRMQTGMIPLGIVLVQTMEEDALLAGAAVLDDAGLHGIVCATLDAINRNLNWRISHDASERKRVHPISPREYAD